MLDEQRVNSDPANGRARLDLSYDLADRGLILLKLGHATAAVELYRKAEKIRAEMVAADSRDARAATALASAEWRLGYALIQAGDRGGAAEEFRSAAHTAERMIRDLPDNEVRNTGIGGRLLEYRLVLHPATVFVRGSYAVAHARAGTLPPVEPTRSECRGIVGGLRGRQTAAA